MKKKHYVGRTILTVLAAVYAFSFLLPTLVTFTNSFMTQSEIAANYGEIFESAAGNGSSWTRGSSAGLRITANGAYAKFTGLMVDGKTVSATCYTAVSGSTVITLKASYLETLSLGKHTITVCYEDGSAEGTFTVTANPYTGDEAQPMLWVAMLLLSAACIVLLLKKRTHAS